ncbi:hypothetical protein KRR55_06085 [Paeniglutamicibacter sp. ABSL32-1]|uniref:TRADD-N-associated membrane domain-containing protein n=1 Tax=Paeniglutamicibacter quisquiliarum TaxID=2849498 RepID=UPI001C2D14D1|nr:hypothetical protein [Paeniglutamicibacter quisquiliarum]MBV1778681.1 hypothetical protein [Paeniglutamicibacter quisquiliarum]
MSEKQDVRARIKAALQTFNKFLAPAVLILMAVYIFGPTVSGSLSTSILDPEAMSALVTTFTALVATIVALFTYSSFKAKKDDSQNNRILENLQTEESTLSESMDKNTDFGSLWAVTQKRIDYYHTIATTQARRSFINTQIATGAGFVLVVVMGFVAASANTTTAAVAAGSVGIVGGGLSAYIGSTFMRSQSEATNLLGSFFVQPVAFSQLLGAERLLEHLEPEQKFEAIKTIITSSMQPPTPPESK